MTNPFSNEFKREFEEMKTRIERLRKDLETQSNKNKRLSDRLSITEAAVQGIGSIVIPARVLNGNRETVEVILDGQFSIGGYKNSSEMPEWLEELPVSFTVPNIINNPAEPGGERIFHGLDLSSAEATITEEDMFPSGVLVVLYGPEEVAPGIALPIFTVPQEPDEDPEITAYGLLYAKPDLKVECIE